MTETTYPTTCEVPVHLDPTTTVLVQVVADPTATPGLVITPELGGDGFTGNWSLTHAASGFQLPLGMVSDDIDAARDYAKALGETPIDWTADKDTTAEQVKEHGDAIKAAQRAALYPPADEDGQWDGEPSEGNGAYPGTEAQATADAIARHLTQSLRHDLDVQADELVKRDDKDGRRMFVMNAASLVSQWGLVLALREFAKVDQQAADWTARQIWLGWQAGDAPSEDSYEWAREYGLPPVKGDEPTVTDAATTAETAVA